MPADAPRKQSLRRYKVGGLWCLLHPECVDGFRSDREHGAIYGPYKIKDVQSGQERFALNAEEASLVARFCPYCGER